MKILAFLYFLTLHADRLSVSLGGFTIRLNNLIALVLLGYVIACKRITSISIEKKIAKALLFFLASIAVSGLLSPYWERCALFFGWFGLTLLTYAFLPYLLILFFDENEILRLYFLSFFCVGIYGVIQFLLPLFGLRDFFPGQEFMGGLMRPSAFAYEPSYYALYMTPFVICANAYYLLAKNQPFFFVKRLNLPMILFINFLYLISTSTSAFFALFIFVALTFFVSFFPVVNQHYSFLRKKLIKAILAMASLTLIFLMLFPEFMTLFFMKFFYKGVEHHSFAERWAGIESGWEIFMRHPFFGVGLGGYPAYFFDHWSQGKVSSEGFLDFATAPIPLKYFEPSNVFIETLASLGIFGLIAILGLIFTYLSKAKEAITFSQEKRALCLCFLLSTLVTIIVLQFNQGLLRTYIWTHLALTYSYFLKASYAEPAPQPEPKPVSFNKD